MGKFRGDKYREEAPASFQMKNAGTSSIARDLVRAFVASVVSHSSLRRHHADQSDKI